jgi:S1-C subfamily serine protease
VGSLVTVGALNASGAFDRRVVERPLTEPKEAVSVLDQMAVVSSGSEQSGWTDAVRRIEPSLARVEAAAGGTTVNGSAVALRADVDNTYFVTSGDLLRRAETITLVLSGDRRKRAEVVQFDQYTNIGVLRVPDEKAPLPTLGSSKSVQPGTDALVAGAPSRTSSSPSAARALVSPSNSEHQLEDGVVLQGLLQTDANIAASAKGGVLLDVNGRVIGLIVAMGSDETGVERFGYAMPIETVKATADSLIDTGSPARVWLGIEGTDLPLDQAQMLGLSGGAVLKNVDSRSPAQMSGLAAGDIIVQIESTPVDGMTTLVMNLRAHKPNDTISLRYVRQAEVRDAFVTLVGPPGAPMPSSNPAYLAAPTS